MKKKVSTIMAWQARTARPQLQRDAQRQLAIPKETSRRGVHSIGGREATDL
jgi:hypothetical protein